MNQDLAKQGHEDCIIHHFQYDANIRPKPLISIQNQGFYLFDSLLYSTLNLELRMNRRAHAASSAVEILFLTPWCLRDFSRK
jgi:hypothetical protein